MGLRRDQGKALKTQAGGQHGPAFPHQAVQFRRGQLAQQAHPGPGMLPRPIPQRAFARHQQFGGGVPQQGPGFEYGGQTFQFLQPPGKDHLVFALFPGQGFGIGQGHRIGFDHQPLRVKGGAQPVVFQQFLPVKIGQGHHGDPPPGAQPPVQGVGQRHHRRLGQAAPVAPVAHRAKKPAVGAVFADLAAAQQNAVGAEQPEIVQRLHHRHAALFGGADHGGAEQQQGIVDVHGVGLFPPDQFPHRPGGGKIPHGPQGQQGEQGEPGADGTGVTILGTDADHVDAAEDRERFDEILEYCDIARPKGQTVFTTKEALAAAHSLGYPVLVRPSYVLGGQGMQIAASDADINEFMGIITRTIPDLSEHPVLVDKYLMGQEVEVDAICDGKDILIPGIMEHVDRAGIHSGDSISVYPAVTLSEKVQKTIVDYTKRLASALHVIGMMNIQFIVLHEEVYIIEVNPRSSRTVPYISKVTGIPAIALATRAMLGEKIADMGYGTGLFRKSGYYAIKLPVFSFEKIIGADTSLGPEMKSTGEVLGISKDFNEALLKAFDGGGVSLPKDGKIIVTVRDKDKPEICEMLKEFKDSDFRFYATPGTRKALMDAGFTNVKPVNKISGDSPNIMDMLNAGDVSLIINTPTHGRIPDRDGFKLRRISVESGTSCLTSLDAAKALMESTFIVPSDKMSLTDIATLAVKPQK